MRRGRARERVRAAVWIMRPKETEGGRGSNSRALLSLSLLCSVPPVAAFAGEEEIDRAGKKGGRPREGGRPFLLVNLRVTTLRSKADEGRAFGALAPIISTT